MSGMIIRGPDGHKYASTVLGGWRRVTVLPGEDTDRVVALHEVMWAAIFCWIPPLAVILLLDAVRRAIWCPDARKRKKQVLKEAEGILRAN